MTLREAPEGFVGRVMARLDSEPRAVEKASASAAIVRMASIWRAFTRPGPAAAMMLLMFLGLGAWFASWHHFSPTRMALQNEQVRGEQASAQLVRALEITGAKLARVHHLLMTAPPPGTAPDKTHTTSDSTN